MATVLVLTPHGQRGHRIRASTSVASRPAELSIVPRCAGPSAEVNVFRLALSCPSIGASAHVANAG
eukprot:121237-Chlamydomonas_euryale.AAC.2